LDNAVALLSLFVVYAVMLTRFDLALLFSDTILTGGDSASWYQVAKTLKEEFLPHGRLFGFSQANFFGYLEGQHYFILPFFVTAMVGYLMPLTIALKLATIAGGFALPLTLFAALYSMTGRKRAGAIAASLSLLFLFNESYTIFGGNWLSTFAGEFCFSWSLSLFPLLAASVMKDVRNPNRRGVGSGILLGLIGLSHFFIFMPAFFLPFFPAFGLIAPLVRGKRDRRKPRGEKGTHPQAREREIVIRLLVTYGTALALMAFWLLPMAATRAWAQPISMIWRFASFADFARQTLAWIWAPAIIILSGISLLQRPRHGPRYGETRRIASFLLYGLLACVFLFNVAPGLGMPDIRFVPTALMLSLMGAAWLIEAALAAAASGNGKWWDTPNARELKRLLPHAAAMAVVIAASAAAIAVTRNSPAWFRWNYSGYEAKAEWDSLTSLAERYKEAPDQGRMLWEKQDQKDNKDFGSERAFENLRLFLGHASSEGIHYGSSMMARASTYLQSSYSQNPVDPEPERIYSRIDPASWNARFSLLNAGAIITHSEEIGALFAGQPSFRKEMEAGKFSVFSFLGFQDRYVSVLPERAWSIVSPGAGGFKADYYRFFREYELYGFPFVSASFADEPLTAAAVTGGGIWKNYEEYRNLYLPKALLEDLQINSSGGAELTAAHENGSVKGFSITAEQVDDFSIRFTTLEPGKPHYIRISYAPGWKSLGGEKVYPVSPGFMLIFPETSRVELKYGRTGWELAGILLSLFALPGALLSRRYRPGPRFPWRPLMGLAFAIFASAAGFLILHSLSGYPALAWDVEEARRLDLSVPAELEKALSLAEPWATRENLGRFDNRLVFDAYRIKALALIRKGRRIEAAEAIDTLLQYYPHTRALDTLPILP